MSGEDVEQWRVEERARLENMAWKTINPLWRLSDPLTVQEAAALIAGVDPNVVRFSAINDVWFESDTGLRDSDGAGWVKTALRALVNAINSGNLRAMIRRDARMQGWDEYPNVGEKVRELYPVEPGEIREGFEPAVIYCENPNWEKTTVDRQDIVAWLSASGIRSGFFFPDASNDAPDYLDPSNSRYAPKLAAAVKAWQAVSDPVGKHPKQALAKWLREHAAEFGMTDDEGKPNETGIEEASKVANWQPGGGAPKTPSE